MAGSRSASYPDRRTQRNLAGAVLITICAVTSAAESVEVPKALWGTWDLGPDPCSLPLEPDLDSPKWIDASSIRGYEKNEIPTRVRRVSVAPAVWVIRTDNDVAPQIVTNDIYVLKGDHLTITDGEFTKHYRRCR